MPSFCSVVKCSMRAERDSVRFFRIPAALKGRGEMLDALSKERRELWIRSLKRGPLSEKFIKNARICSKHFITGAPADLLDKNNPDWAPSQYMGYTTATTKTIKSIDRHYRTQKRKEHLKLPVEKENEKSMILDTGPSSSSGSTTQHLEIAATEVNEQSVSVAVQTDLTVEQLCGIFSDLKFCNSQVYSLKRRLDSCDLSEDSFKNDDSKALYFTGLMSSKMLFIFYELIFPHLSPKKALSPFQQLLLTLMKLRLNLPFKYMAYRFCVCPTTASETFLSTLEVLYSKLKHFIYWPDRKELRRNVPACFNEAFGERVAVIIDCFEVFTETPSKVMNASQCWSTYKHHETIKFLIGITPHGTISFISKAWGGKTSDKHLTENCGLLNLILPGDIILADRGFLVEESANILGAQLKIPAFTKGKSQLHPKELEYTRNIATVRIHVERIIGFLKKKFKIFHQTIPVSLLSKKTVLDEMIVVCSAITNLCNSQIPSD